MSGAIFTQPELLFAGRFRSESDAGFPMHTAGVSLVWRKLMTQAAMAAPHLQFAILEGESGTGKHTLARAIFSSSALSRTRFLRRDAREWLASETDPARLSGFIYLDRVDLLAATGQGLLLGLLKALQDRTPGQVVLLASSHAPLREMVGRGMMLPDLAFRVSGVRFAIPPLRHRKEDIAPLAQSILDHLCTRYQQKPAMFAPGSLARLLSHDWPGNVRELSCVLESALLEAAHGVIRPADLVIGSRGPLGRELGMRESDSQVAAPQESGSLKTDCGEALAIVPTAPSTLEDLSLDAVIRRHIVHVLWLNHGNKLRAARQLGISRSTLYRLLPSEDGSCP